MFADLSVKCVRAQRFLCLETDGVFWKLRDARERVERSLIFNSVKHVDQNENLFRVGAIEKTDQLRQEAGEGRCGRVRKRTQKVDSRLRIRIVKGGDAELVCGQFQCNTRGLREMWRGVTYDLSDIVVAGIL